MIRKELSQEEKLLSYAKYYYLDRDPVDPVALQTLKEPMAKEDVLWPEDIAEIFKPGYQRVVNGYYIGDGYSYSTAYTKLYGVTPEMIDWWFTWLFVPPVSVPREYGNLRYKIWHPDAHFDHFPADEESEKRLCDETIPLNLRRQGVKEYAFEAIDEKNMKRNDMFMRCYDDLDLPKEAFDYLKATGTLNIFANDHSVILQYFKKTPYGCEATIRTWRGYILKDGKIIRMSEPYATPTKQHLIDDIIHILSEFPHMMKFLPQLYSEERNKPIKGY